MKPRQRARMYWREGRGWYADFRNFAAEGGGQEALIPEGASRATYDQGQAALLFARRLQELQDIRDGRLVREDPGPIPTFREYLPRHVERREDSVVASTLAKDKALLERMLPTWGDLRLPQFTRRRINDWILDMRRQGLAPQTIRHRLCALSTLLGHAVSDGYLPYNPAHGDGVDRPQVERGPAHWLESAEGHQLLVAAAELDRDPGFHGMHCMEVLIGTALLTGGRRDEIFALQVPDLDFDAGLVHFRPNTHYPRRKSKYATRSVPLWLQVRRILVTHVGQRESGLVFPGLRGKPLHDARGSLDKVFENAKLKRPAGRAWHLFRHTYTAMRLQTLDHGEPVSLFTVARELGHGSVQLIEETYGHLLKQRKGQRLSVVEYRPVEVAREEQIA